MKALLKRIIGPAGRSKQESGLRKIQKLAGNLETVAGTSEYPPHVIARGKIKMGTNVSETTTAVYPRGNVVEFSTNVGQLPNSQFGGAITERLNQTLDGKFVNSDAERRDRTDLLYATRKPGGWLNAQRFSNELEHHAKTKVAVDPILRSSLQYGQTNTQLGYPQVRNAARDVVDTQLGLQNRLASSSKPTRYFRK